MVVLSNMGTALVEGRQSVVSNSHWNPLGAGAWVGVQIRTKERSLGSSHSPPSGFCVSLTKEGNPEQVLSVLLTMEVKDEVVGPFLLTMKAEDEVVGPLLLTVKIEGEVIASLHSSFSSIKSCPHPPLPLPHTPCFSVG